jgi:hypothetical protein
MNPAASKPQQAQAQPGREVWHRLSGDRPRNAPPLFGSAHQGGTHRRAGGQATLRPSGPALLSVGLGQPAHWAWNIWATSER